MVNFKSILFFLFILFSQLSCVTTVYVNYESNCLTHNPKWKTYFDVLPLRDLTLRVDAFIYKGIFKDMLGHKIVKFESFNLIVTMNKQLPKPAVPSPKRKPTFIGQDIKINLFVSEILDESIIFDLKKEDVNKNIEKGYIGNNNFLYINDYNNLNSYLLVNLYTRRAYKLQQDEDNLQYTYRSLNAFVQNGCYQGIQFLAKGGAFSLGDCLMF